MRRRKRQKRKFETASTFGGHFKKMQEHPICTAVILLILYFIMDDVLLDVKENAKTETIFLCLFITLAVFYSCYVMGYQTGAYQRGKDIPIFIRHQKRYMTWMFWILTILTGIISLGYDEIITRWMPNLNNVYYPSQVLLLVLIAPIIEELAFRYFLYERWALKKYGTIVGVLITGLLFVICHPVTGMDSMILYWIPTLLFYLIYDSFGIYGSIAAHILFNFIAL